MKVSLMSCCFPLCAVLELSKSELWVQLSNFIVKVHILTKIVGLEG